MPTDPDQPIVKPNATALDEGAAPREDDVPLERQRDEDIDDQLLDPEDIIRANPRWSGASTLANAASFDASVPAAVAAAKANQIRNVDFNGEFSLSNGGGTLETTFEQMFGMVDAEGKKKDVDEDDGWGEYLDAHERRAEAKREMEANHTEYAGQSLTEPEWAALRKWFDDPENVAGWEQAMMAETGQSLEEVRRTGGRVRRFLELRDKFAHGEPMTTSERTEFQTLRNDQDVRQSVEMVHQRMDMDRHASTHTEVTAQIAEARSESVSQGNDLIAARAELNAEPLTPVYNAAATDASPGAIASQPVPASTPPRIVAAINPNLDMG